MEREQISVKVIGSRRPGKGGIVAAAGLLKMVLILRGDKPFIPKGVFRFSSFQESESWSLKMMTRNRTPRRRFFAGRGPSNLLNIGKDNHRTG
jgi:hypothetical protein